MNNKLTSFFTEKINNFNNYSASQCSPTINSSVVPTTISHKTEARLTSINFEDRNIITVIRSLNVNKAHCHDVK